MLQRKRRVSAGKRHLIGLIAATGVIFALWCQPFVSLADDTGTVTVSSAVIREKADTNSAIIGSAAYGSTVSIRDEVQDASGTLWYQVYVNANKTGYIRSDLVDKAGGGSSNSASQVDDGETASGASGASVEPDTVLDAQYAVVSAEAIKVRTAPSTNETVVDRLNRDAQVIIGGEMIGSDGKKWYYVTFTGTNGAERTGYIRADLLSLGDMVPVSEEETPEPQETDPEPAEPMNYDYELTYERDEDGSYSWYLYDYTEGQNGNRQRLQQLLDAAQTQSDEVAADTKTLVRQRVAIVILIVLIVLMASVLVIMALKLRDVYYEEYEDEDEEEQEQETKVSRRSRTEETEESGSQRRRRAEEAEGSGSQRRRRAEEAEGSGPQRRRRAEETEGSGSQRRRRMEETGGSGSQRRSRTGEADARAERTARRREERADRESGVREVEYREDEAIGVPVKKESNRKAKNFLLDDDEFEFEFLNMDDKD